MGSEQGAAPEGPFQHLVSALRAGEDGAWRELTGRYTRRLVGLARSRLEPRLQQRVACDEVVQSVYRTFFRQLRAGKFDLPDWDSVFGLLIVLTARKCCRAVVHHTAQKRDVRREVAPAATADGPGDGPAPEPVDRQPTPAEAALLVETIHGTLRGLDERERRIVVLGLLGYGDPEISAEVGRTQYRVRQVRKRYAAQVQGLDTAEAGA
jgi:RNA polymerase sigma-70 factor (ECF subfamily)